MWTRAFSLGLLLLSATCVCLCHSYNGYDTLEYGQTYKIPLHRLAKSVEFEPEDSSDEVVLWKRDESVVTEDSRWKVTDNELVLTKVTQRDSGFYTVKDKYQRLQFSETLEVTAPTKTFELNLGEHLSFEANLEMSSCNIYFFPNGANEVFIFRHGRRVDSSSCEGFYALRPCGIKNERLQPSCNGYIEVRDNNDDKALVVYVDIISSDFSPMYLVVGGFVVLVILVCCCVMRCCYGRPEKNRSKSTPEPAVHYQTYEDEPSRRNHNQLSEPSSTRYTAQSPNATTGPLIHSPPTSNVPPAYSEVFPHTQLPDASIAPISSDPVPRFEVRGTRFNFTSPLSSDSPSSDVYTSDKLNFL